MPQMNSGVIPEPTFTYLALIISSLTIGYWIGLGKSLGYTRGNNNNHSAKSHQDNSSSSSDSENNSHHHLQSNEKSNCLTEDSKLVLVVRSDLGMTKGKIAAQCSHATLACYKSAKKTNPECLRHWERSGQAKIALKLQKTDSSNSEEDEMNLLKSKARSLGLIAQDISDAGRTQIAAGSKTVLGIGPGPVRLINQVTQHLKLL